MNINSARKTRTHELRIIKNNHFRSRFEVLDRIMKNDLQKTRREIFILTIYHSQTDDQSEQTNQSVKIALRYYLCYANIKNWSTHFSTIQFLMNNSTFAIIKKVFNEAVYECISINSLNIAKNIISFNSSETRKEIIDTLIWTQTRMKLQYD
jgi:hypothetical protein